MDFFECPYYRLYKRLLSIIGHWPHQSTWKKCFHQTLIVVWLLTIMIPELIKLYDVRGDLKTVFECIPPLGLHAVIIIKWINCIVNSNKLKKLLIYMELDWKSRDEGNDNDILRKYAGRGRVLTVIYTYYLFISATLYTFIKPISPIVLDIIKPLNESRPREFLYHTEYFVDQNQFYVPIFLHALMTTFTSVTILVAVDTTYSAYIHYACAMFAELGQQLENGLKNKDERLDVSVANDYAYQHIVKCVKKQKEAIEFCNLLESTYTVYFLVVIGVNGILISITGVQTVIMLEDNWPLALQNGAYTLGQIIHVFFGCWHGQLLIDHSLYINKAIYKSKWYVSSFRSRRLLAIMMMRSAKPCQLSAAKLFFLCLETFTTIMKSAMSYFTVLRTLRYK